MGLLDFIFGPDIQTGIEEYQKNEGAVLLDVRTASEYAQGHIPGGQNIPLQELNRIKNIITDKETRIFTYCHSGTRSGMAEVVLKRMGYPHVVNIGGISSYSGPLEK